MRRTTRTGWVLLVFVGLCGPLRAEARAAVKVAVLPGDGQRAPKAGVVELLTVELSKQPQIEILDREQIDRILREQKLSATGLMERSTAIRGGKLLRVDGFLFVERFNITRDAGYRLQLVEARTGLVVGSQFLDAGLVEKDVGAALRKLAPSLAWLTLPEKRRRYIGLLGFSADPRREDLRSPPDALAAILARELGRSPDIAIVDREHVAKLQAEKELTGVDRELARSTYLIEGQVRPAPDAPGSLDIHAVARPLRGRDALAVLTVRCSESGLVGAGTQLAREILKQINAAPPVPSEAIPASEEAKWFRERAKRIQACSAYADFEPSVPALECAYAFDPTPESALDLAVALKLSPGVMGKSATQTEEGKRRALRQLGRALRLEQQYLDARNKGKTADPLEYHGVHRLDSLWRDLSSDDPETAALYSELRELKERARTTELAFVRERWPKHFYGPNTTPASSGYYWKYAWGEEGDIRYLSETAEEYAVQMKELMTPWLDMPGYTSPYVMWMLLQTPWYRTLRNDLPDRYKNPEGMKQLLDWCAWVRSQPSLHFRLAGNWYEIVLESEHNKRTPQPRVDEFWKLRREYLRQFGAGGLISSAEMSCLTGNSNWREFFQGPLECSDRRSFVRWYAEAVMPKEGYWIVMTRDMGKEFVLNWVDAAIAKLPSRELGKYRTEHEQAFLVSVYDHLLKRRAELLSAAPVPEPSLNPYWQRYRIDELQTAAAPYGRSLQLLERRGDGLVGVWVSGGSEAEVIQPVLLDANANETAVFPAIPLHRPIPQWGSAAERVVPHGDKLYVASGGGLGVFSQKSARLLTRKDGLPSDHLLSVAIAGNRLYLGFRDGYLWTMDVQTGRFRELAYRGSLKPRNELDGCGQPFSVSDLLPDPDRGVVWMLTHEGFSGMWRISMADDAIRRVASADIYSTLSWSGGHIVRTAWTSLSRYRVDDAQWEPIPLYALPRGIRHPPYLVMGDDVFSTGMAVAGSYASSAGAVPVEKGGLFLNRSDVQKAFYRPLPIGGRCVDVNHMVATSDREAILANRQGQFWRLIQEHDVLPVESQGSASSNAVADAVRTPTNGVAPARVTASSYGSFPGKEDFQPARICDGDPATCWAANTNDVIGAWVAFEFERPVRLSGIRLVNGWVPDKKRLTLYPVNHRVKRLEVSTDQGERTAVEVAGHNDPQYLALPFGKPAGKVTLTVREIHESERIVSDDPPWLNISEATFYERPVTEEKNQ